MHIFCLGINGISGTHLLGEFEFLIVDIGSDNRCTTQGRTDDGTHAYHSATYYHNCVSISHSATVDSVKTNAHRLNQGNLLLGKSKLSGSFLRLFNKRIELIERRILNGF